MLLRSKNQALLYFNILVILLITITSCRKWHLLHDTCVFTDRDHSSLPAKNRVPFLSGTRFI